MAGGFPPDDEHVSLIVSPSIASKPPVILGGVVLTTRIYFYPLTFYYGLPYFLEFCVNLSWKILKCYVASIWVCVRFNARYF